MNEVRVRSGRQARQAERAQKGHGVGRPYIVRNIPTYDVLSEETSCGSRPLRIACWPRPGSSSRRPGGAGPLEARRGEG
jgi:hypothetical protein